ncbi:hypothetical protein ACHAW5_010480 [Stephanodiscus triporus]|uniref:Pre-nudix hydrolase domain-containing protein n=1 Tax=Stephanodiscus triporus TaxID=2934178 RepID=A0ABD3NEK3_9STRA
MLGKALEIWTETGRKGIWPKIPTSHSHLVAPACSLHGFDFQHAEPGYCVLTRWPPTGSASRLPNGPTHQVGVGALVIHPVTGKMLAASFRPSPFRSALAVVESDDHPKSSTVNDVHMQLRRAAGSKDPGVLPAFLRSSSRPPLPLDVLSTTRPTTDGPPCTMACWTGHVDNVALLLDMGCDMNMIATRSHNYGKSPIFFAATRGREDVMNLLLDRGANVLIVNNKGQSVYSVAMSHFDKSGSLIRRIRETEEAVLRMDGANGIMPLFDDGGGGGCRCWIDYSKTHRDGNVYGDLDLLFLDRPLVEGDVVDDGVVNPTTPGIEAWELREEQPERVQVQEEDEEKRGRGRKERRRMRRKRAGRSSSSVAIEREVWEGCWNDVRSAMVAENPWGLLSSLLTIVEVAEGARIKYPWAVEGAVRLEFLCNDVATAARYAVAAPDERITAAAVGGGIVESTLDDAIVFCGSGDRHARLVKRLQTKARHRDEDVENGERGEGASSLTPRDELLLEHLWHDE